MIQCVGSREEDHPYCCRVCCSTAVANALKIKELNPQTEVIVLYRDMRTYAQKELYYKKAREAGVRFVRYEPEPKPEVTLERDQLEVKVLDQNLKTGIIRFNPDYLVLSAAIRPAPESKPLASLLKLPWMPTAFSWRPISNCGRWILPMPACSSAVWAMVPNPWKRVSPRPRGLPPGPPPSWPRNKSTSGGQVAVVDQERCIVCMTCVRTCPFGVPQVNAEGMIEINPAACQGCGNCASACPRKLIQVQHQRDDQIIAKEMALFEWGGTARSWGSVFPEA